MKRFNPKLNALFCVAKEMKPENGEDSFFFDSADDKFIVAAFDGCGGSGAKKYENYSGKTGAYVASRAVCGGVEKWFNDNADSDRMISYVSDALTVCKHYADKTGTIRGSLSKAFPTTAAVVVGKMQKNTLSVNCFWAGDSRCYLLDSRGLHQLTDDDLDVKDAMANLTADGVMTNVVNASTYFEIHNKTISVTEPCILISATDGCFGYLSSPMAFEHMLTATLVKAKNLNEWKTSLFDSMSEIAGDDFTLCTAVVGYKDFDGIKQDLFKRNEYVAQNFLNENYDLDDLWEIYKKDYSVYL